MVVSIEAQLSDHAHAGRPIVDFAAVGPSNSSKTAPAPLVPRFLRSLSKQHELRGIARGLGKPEMAEGMRGQQTPARGALNEAFLDQERLNDFLNGVARLG